VTTWRAEPAAGQDVSGRPCVIRLFATQVMSEPSFEPRSIREELERRLPQCERSSPDPLVVRDGARCRVTPWERIDFTDDGRFLALVRPWYPVSFARAPNGPGAAPWRLVAAAADRLLAEGAEPRWVLNPDDWMIGDDAVWITDRGAHRLVDLIAGSFEGPRISSSFVLPLPLADPDARSPLGGARPTQGGSAVVAFAAVLHWVRFGCELFSGLTPRNDRIDSHLWMRAVTAQRRYVSHGEIPSLESLRERSPGLFRAFDALLREPGRWTECEAWYASVEGELERAHWTTLVARGAKPLG